MVIDNNTNRIKSFFVRENNIITLLIKYINSIIYLKGYILIIKFKY